jgi:uncharacterized membrane protein YqjE
MATPEGLEQKQSTSFFNSMSLLLKNAINIGSDLINLILLETEAASKSLIKIIGICLAIGLLVFTLWLLLQAVIVIWLINMGYSWLVALLSLVGINVLSIMGMACLLRRCGKHIAFMSTRRQLKNLSGQNLAK